MTLSVGIADDRSSAEVLGGSSKLKGGAYGVYILGNEPERKGLSGVLRVNTKDDALVSKKCVSHFRYQVVQMACFTAAPPYFCSIHEV